ncbi:VWA domain-containing protein [Haloferax namakaokahaiae]|uniref:VWA domain-containing protein n=1 Tax=Haloferax namakaokahaiae TaxID=1748331 RepID=A0ABD5ZIX3_9EURY
MAPGPDFFDGNDAGQTQPPGWQNVPDFRLARRHVVTELIRFTRTLRHAGVSVPANGSLDGASVLAVMGLSDRAAVADALRATLLVDAEDGDAFDEAFPDFWHRLRTGLDRIATDEGGLSPDGDESDDTERERPVAQLQEDESDDADTPETLGDAAAPEMGAGDEPGRVDVRIPTGMQHSTSERPASTDPGDGNARRYSAVGGREAIDGDTPPLSERDQAAVERFVDALATIPGRRSRRTEDGKRVDARRALRASIATGGTPIRLPTREPVVNELRCCLLVDVSGSVLDTVDRETLLAFAEALQTSARAGSVFLFDTDLVDATDQFARAKGNPAAALRAAEIDWGGGTRIGDAFETLRREHPHAIDRRTAVVVVSDGLDVGDQETLQRGVTWLAGRANALVWLNPLAVSPAYEPKSKGMATCLPYVDALFGFATPADLAEAARQLERRGTAGPIGYEYDPRRRRSRDGAASNATSNATPKTSDEGGVS